MLPECQTLLGTLGGTSAFELHHNLADRYFTNENLRARNFTNEETEAIQRSRRPAG